ncbi:hypothetical protein [Leptothoe spongobia]|uniref:Uncharacterized protein n=1 Tax=Leptothoe spongobia TAU-MAC 1115 TaxID=1967444 RepID=A0A947DI22_9CYAN|nr:hypothetical protein [Leptothoe spongobia]MBT9317557.1 hypothetical protein [Leptothoe spongobia TAU-MAC 1115]
MAARSIRKSVSFDESKGDKALLDAIAAHQSEHAQSFNELCKQALHQYLLSREPTQSVLLFMELQHQVAQLGVRVAALEDETSIASAFSQPESPIAATKDTITETVNDVLPTDHDSSMSDDPVLSRLGPLLDDF